MVAVFFTCVYTSSILENVDVIFFLFRYSMYIAELFAVLFSSVCHFAYA